MTPEEAKEYLESVMREDLKTLSPRDRVNLYFGQVLEYFIPKRQRSSIDSNDNKLPKDIYNES